MDLATTHPELAAQWHPTMNGDLTPQDITADYEKTIFWLVPIQNLKTGKFVECIVPARIIDRIKHKKLRIAYHDFKMQSSKRISSVKI